MILGILVVISGQMSLKIVDFCPAKVISNSRYFSMISEEKDRKIPPIVFSVEIEAAFC